MKDIVNKFLANLHFFILAYSLYNVYIAWEEHVVQIEGVQSQYAGLDADTAKTKKSIAEIEENKTKINEFKLRVEEVAKNIEAVQKQLPAEINDIQITTFLNKEMDTVNIKESKIVPGAEVISTYFVSKDFNLKGQGTFLQFLIFFERIANAARIYNIKTLNFTSSAEVQKGRFKIIEANSVIQAFRFNPEFKVDLGFDKTPAAGSGAGVE